MLNSTRRLRVDEVDELTRQLGNIGREAVELKSKKFFLAQFLTKKKNLFWWILWGWTSLFGKFFLIGQIVPGLLSQGCGSRNAPMIEDLEGACLKIFKKIQTSELAFGFFS